MIKELKLPECLELLSNHYIGHLGFISGKSPFILPITYFHDTEEKCIVSYSAIGYKIRAMRKYAQVALQVESILSMQNWRSVLVHGSFEELKGSTAKKYLHTFVEGVQGTRSRINDERPKFIQDLSSKLQKESPPIIYRIHISDIIGRYRED